MTEMRELPLEDLHVDPANVRPKPAIHSERGLYPDVGDEGVLEPLVVRPHEGEGKYGRGGKYGVIIGSRRLEAAKNAGLDEVPCVIRRDLEGDDSRAERLSFKENEHRSDIPEWKKEEIIQGEYEETDARMSKSKRVREVMERLNVSEGTVYKYVSFKKLHPTLNSRIKEPSERSDEEIKELDSTLSRDHSALSTEEGDGVEIGEGEKYEREKAQGFPTLKKLPVDAAAELVKSDFFLDLQEEDPDKAHEIATEAAQEGKDGVSEVIERWKKSEGEGEGRRPSARELVGKKPLTLTVRIGLPTVEKLDEWMEENDMDERKRAVPKIVRLFLAEEGYMELA